MDESGLEAEVKIKPEAMKLREPEIKVHNSLEETLDEGLYEDLTKKVKSETKWRDGTLVKLFKHKERFYFTFEHELGDNLSSLQIIDPPERGSWEVTRMGDVEWRKAYNILLINKESGKVFDVASLVPSKFVLRCIISSTPSQDRDFSCFQSGKYSTRRPNDNLIQYYPLTTPERVLILFHEVGHMMFENDEPDLAKEYMDFQERLQPTEREEHLRHRELIAAVERGASARALWLMRRLKKEGIDLGLTNKEARNSINEWLESYGKFHVLYGSERGRRFTRTKGV